MRLRVVVIFGSLLLLSLPLFSQPHREAITVEVVNVPVHVTHGGQPIEGLTRDDFELFVNGRPQPIEYFDVIGSAGDAPVSMRERRLFLLLFDVAATMPHAIVRAQKAAATLVSGAPAGDYFAIATYSGRRGVEFASAFTSDRTALLKAIAQLDARDDGDPLRLVVTPSDREAIEAFEHPQLVESRDPFDVESRFAATVPRELLDAPAKRAVEHQLLSLAQLGDRLAQLDGRKHVIFLSQGSRVSSNPFGFGRVRNGGDAPEIQAGSRWWRMMEELYRSYQTSDVFLHTLNTNGLGVVTEGFNYDSLRNLSRGAGGRAMNNRNDFTSALADLAESQRTGYLLGFRPADVRRGYNSVVLKVKGIPRTSRVTYRYGFSGAAPEVDLNDGLYLADVVLNDVPQTGIAASLEAGKGVLIAQLPTRMAAAQLGKDGTAELLIYIFDERGVAVDFRREAIHIPANATQDDTLTLLLTLPPGKYVAKALLRVDGSLGLSRTTIESL